MHYKHALLLSVLFAGAATAQTDSFKVISEFTNASQGAGSITAPLVQDMAGNLYSTLPAGGSNLTACAVGCGVIYKVDSQTGIQTVLYNFTGGPDGGEPLDGVILDPNGNLLGTTLVGGGSSSSGTVFKLTPTGALVVLKTFDATNHPADGSYPSSGLVADPAGNLYGVTTAGGDVTKCFSSGCGVVYKIDPSGNYSVLHVFEGAPTDGSNADAALAIDSAGNLYGTTSLGGANSLGVLFEVSPSGAETILHNFTGGVDGAYPASTPVLDGSGNLYGTALNYARINPNGAVWKYNSASGFSALTGFGSSERGRYPVGRLNVDPNTGALFGATYRGGTGSCPNGCGVLFELLPGADFPNVLYNFMGGTDGSYPYSGMRVRSLPNGAGYLFFGTAQSGNGTNGQPSFPTVYRLSFPAPQ